MRSYSGCMPSYPREDISHCLPAIPSNRGKRRVRSLRQRPLAGIRVDEHASCSACLDAAQAWRAAIKTIDSIAIVVADYGLYVAPVFIWVCWRALAILLDYLAPTCGSSPLIR